MTGTKIRKARDPYFGLVRRFPLRPIRSESQYDAAVEIMNRLAVRKEGTLDAAEQDYLEVLSDLVAAYDEKNFPIPSDDLSPRERLAAMVSEAGMTHGDLAAILGVSRPLASLLLDGRRQLTASHIRKLAARFKVDAGYFL